MSTDIIPVIYSLRSKLNGSCSHSEQVDAIADTLQKLERIYADYDNLEIVKTMKQMLADQLLRDSIDVNIRNHLQMRGFEPIRRAVISTQIPPSTDDVNLLGYQYAPSSNKKQKSGGYSMSFNFDDFPMFETVDSMLAGLRNDRTDRESLNKILALDLSELVDHPQWEELLLTLHQSVSIPGEHTTIVMAIYHRFVTGFKGSSQGLDAMNASLMYLAEEWIPSSTTSHTADPRHVVTTKQQMALFCTVLQASATSVQVPYQKEADRAVVLVFLILSKGTVPTTISSAGIPEPVGVIDVLVGTKEQGVSISALLRAIHPFTAFSYAVQTGLLRTLLNSATHHSATSSDPVRCYRVAFIRLRVLLSLLSNFGDNAARAIEFVEHNLRTENVSVVFDAGAFEWQGHVSTLTEKIIAPIEQSNKRFLHLSQAQSLMQWFQHEHATSTSTAQYFSSWMDDALSTLSSLLHSVLTSTTITPSDATLLGEILNLSLQVSSSFPLVDHVQIDKILSACRNMVDFLTQHAENVAMNDVLVGYMTGLTTLLDRGIALPVECVTRLLQRNILSLNGSVKYTSDTQCAFVRLLSANVMCADVENVEHIVLIAQLCVGHLQLAGNSENRVSGEVRLLLLQLLQTLCVYPAYCDVLRAQKLLLPSAAALLSSLLNPDYIDLHTADSNQRIARAVLSAFALCSETEIMECLLEDELLRVMEEEYLDADTWDRALDAETDRSRVFSAVFAVLLGLASLGHVNVLNAVLGESWGVSIAAGGINELTDLTNFCVNLCLRSEGSLSLASENVFPYIVRLLGAQQQNTSFCRSLAVLYEERRSSAAEYVSDAEGIDLVDAFIASSLSNIEALEGSHEKSTFSCIVIPCTELELQNICVQRTKEV